MAQQQTPLHDWHVSQGANMIGFGGYEMPLWYPWGAKKEHLSVITKAGLFDTSHMSVLLVKGPDAFQLLQYCFTRDLNQCVGKHHSPLRPGRCTYGVFLNEAGQTIDDAIIYMLDHEMFMIVVNAGMGGTIIHHLMNYRDGRNVQAMDITNRVGKMDLQGPYSARILSRILSHPREAYDGLSYFSFQGNFDESLVSRNDVQLEDGTGILLSRTGYTGEFGFEIFTKHEDMIRVWEMILYAGKSFDLLPCGLAARDSLRVGAVLPLSHQDIGPWPFINHPWSVALPLENGGNGFSKQFLGGESLQKEHKPDQTYPFIGFDLRKVSLSDHAVVLDSKGKEIGTVLTCATDMGIGRSGERVYSISSPNKPEGFVPSGLSCGFVRVKVTLPYRQIVSLKDNSREIKAVITKDIRPDRTARRLIREMI